MAIALVSLGTYATSGAQTFGQATTAGNLLIAWALGSGTTPSTPAGWTLAGSTWSTGSTSGGIFYKPNCGASETAPGFAGMQNVQLAEFSGAATSSTFDQGGGFNNAAGTSPSTATSGAADGDPADLHIGLLSTLLTKSATATTTLSLTNVTSTVAAGNQDSTSQSFHGRTAYGFGNANATADQATGSNSSMNLASMTVILASFKPAPLVLTPPNVNMPPYIPY